MKEIKETITKEYTVTKYQSFDGEKFDTEEECQKYENSAAGVLFGKIDDFTIKTDCILEPDENDENKYKAVIPRNQHDIDLLNQLWKLYEGKTKEDLRFDGTYIKSLIFIGYRFYYNCNPGELDWVWFYDLKSIVKKACGDKYIVKLIDNNED